MKQVTVIGHDGTGFGAAARAALEAATLVVGCERHLSDVDTSRPGRGPRGHDVEVGAGHHSGVETFALVPIAAAAKRILEHNGPAVVIASGDPGFFGIVRFLRAAGLEPQVIPAVSSVAVAFARAGLAWDDAIVVSAHGRDLRPAVNVCRAHPKVAVLTGPGAGPAEIGAALAGVPRTLIVAERLGMPDERVSTVDSADAKQEWDELSVVIVLDPARPPSAEKGWVAGAQPGPAAWALPESHYAHRDSMITKAEVRAVVLARLGPRLGELVWDIGAGSGSVAVECARFGAAVIAVDRDPAAATMIARNASGLSLQIVTGHAPECLDALPDPDAVFVGGGGPSTLAACAARRPRRLVAAFAALERVEPAMTALSRAGYEVEAVQLQANRLSPLPDGSHRLAATNPVFVVSGGLP